MRFPLAVLPTRPSHVCTYFDCAAPVRSDPSFCREHYDVLCRKLSNARHNRRDRRRYLIEAPTRDRVIDPILMALGWKRRPKVWVDEVPMKIPPTGKGGPSDQRADYVLYAPRRDLRQPRPYVIIEAKRIRKELDQRDENQLLGYMERIKVSKGVLTNGFEWRFYRLKEGKLDPLCQVDLNQKYESVATMLISNLARPKPQSTD